MSPNEVIGLRVWGDKIMVYDLIKWIEQRENDDNSCAAHLLKARREYQETGQSVKEGEE